MKSMKLIALLLISFIATGSVIYQLRNRRRPQPTVVMPAPSTAAVPALPPAPAPVAAPTGATPEGAATERVPIPPEGWGRNPFFSLEEINKANAPPPQVIVEQAPPPVPAQPQALPSYSLTGIISGRDGIWAIVNSRLVQAGDQLGSETVKEIKDRAVVLESDGRTRELRMGQIQDKPPDATKSEPLRTQAR